MLEQVIKKSILLAYFHDSGKQNFYFRDPIFFPFANREPPPPPPCYYPLYIIAHKEEKLIWQPLVANLKLQEKITRVPSATH